MKVEKVTGIAKEVIDGNNSLNGFFGISIRHRFFSKINMIEYFKWISPRFKGFNILLMDDPDKYNLMVLKNYDDDEALKRAREISDLIKIGYERNLKHLNIENIKVIQFRDFINDPMYITFLQKIRDFVSHNSKFKKSLEVLMEKNVGIKIKEFFKTNSFSKEDEEKKRHTLLQYIIEEIASILYMTEKGFKIEIDPTEEFLTKTDIYNGLYPDLNKALGLTTERGHIFLQVENQSYYNETD